MNTSVVRQLTDPEGTEQPFDLLFVHGMAGGSWIWRDNARGAFREAGYRSWAVDLAGEDGSRREATLHDYAERLVLAAETVGRPTVVVAHSLGGAAAQLALQTGFSPAGLVLLCSVPPYGLWRASCELFMRDPQLWFVMGSFGTQGPHAEAERILKSRIFGNRIDDNAFRTFKRKLRPESVVAMSHAIGFPPFAPPPGPRENILVLGGREDPLVPPADVAFTGAYYGAETHLIDEAGHMLMYEPAAAEAVAVTLDWLDRLAA